MKTPIVALVLAAILAGGLLAADSGEPAGRELHLDILLTDGTRLLGTGADIRIGLAAAFGELDLVLADGDRIDWNSDQETVTFRSRYGDVIRGVLISPVGTRVVRTWNGLSVSARSLNPSIVIRPYGASEPRTVPYDRIQSLRAMDPIRIAGSEGASWEIEYENASGWAPENRAGVLTVKGIDADAFYSGSGGPWSTVKLRRAVEQPGDFHLEAELSWDDKGAGLRAMQNLYLSVLGREGGLVAAVGHNDAWVGETGARYSQLPGVARAHTTGYNSQPTRGRAKVGILRKDGEITILWDGVTKQCGASAAAVGRIEVQFDFYDYRNSGRNSAFGTVTLHRLELH